MKNVIRGLLRANQTELKSLLDRAYGYDGVVEMGKLISANMDLSYDAYAERLISNPDSPSGWDFEAVEEYYRWQILWSRYPLYHFGLFHTHPYWGTMLSDGDKELLDRKDIEVVLTGYMSGKRYKVLATWDTFYGRDDFLFDLEPINPGLIGRFLVGLLNLSQDELRVADFDQDGKVSILDIIKALRAGATE